MSYEQFVEVNNRNKQKNETKVNIICFEKEKYEILYKDKTYKKTLIELLEMLEYGYAFSNPSFLRDYLRKDERRLAQN